MSKINPQNIQLLFKKNKSEFLFLAFLLVLSLSALPFSYGKSRLFRETYETAHDNLVNLKGILKQRQQQLELERSTEDSAQNFLLSWSPFVGEKLQPMSLLEKIEKIAKDLRLEITAKTALKENLKDKDQAVIKISLVGPLENLLTWLGKAEEALPLMQIDLLEIKEGSNILTLALEFKYPLIK